MKLGFFSDVHSNLEALKAVLADAESEKLDRLYFLGDAVGYGPNPNKCVELIYNNADVCLMGNHDHAALGLTNMDCFNRYARTSIEFTKRILTRKSKDLLGSFIFEHISDDFHLVHSSPLYPKHWEYITSIQEVSRNFPFLKSDICIIGHTHSPKVFCREEKGDIIQELHVDIRKLSERKRYIINVGSVGQPRDNNPDSCYLIYDTESRIINFKRIPYDFKKTQKKMAKAGLPDFLIERLGNYILAEHLG
ncbi:MAG: metallophosphoesterase family protein [bacterium]|nr:metallophosphoesterase family protein [bacterium]